MKIESVRSSVLILIYFKSSIVLLKCENNNNIRKNRWLALVDLFQPFPIPLPYLE